MSPGNWSPKMIAQGVLWILLAFLVWSKPGTGKSEAQAWGQDSQLCGSVW